MTTLAPANNILTEETAYSANHMLKRLAGLGITPACTPEVTPSESLEATLVTFAFGVVDITLTPETRKARFSHRGDTLELTLLWGDFAFVDAASICGFVAKAEKQAAEAVAKTL